jgi:MoxR-like ATPase
MYIHPLELALRQIYIAQEGSPNDWLPTLSMAVMFSIGDRTVGRLVPGRFLVRGAVGMGKTLLADLMMHVSNLAVSRIQCMPDTQPRDIIGYEFLHFDPDTQRYEVEVYKGPVHADIVAVDEVNRMSSRGHAAFLEVGAEAKVTIGKKTIDLPESYITFTANPIENDGTTPLGAALRDRISASVVTTAYTSRELLLIHNKTKKLQQLRLPIIVEDPSELQKTRETIFYEVEIPDQVAALVAHVGGYINERGNSCVLRGLSEQYLDGDSPFEQVEGTVSQRWMFHTLQLAQVIAAMDCRETVSIRDFQKIAVNTLSHRIKFSPALLAELMAETCIPTGNGALRRPHHQADLTAHLAGRVIDEGVRDWFQNS